MNSYSGTSSKNLSVTMSLYLDRRLLSDTNLAVTISEASSSMLRGSMMWVELLDFWRLLRGENQRQLDIC